MEAKIIITAVRGSWVFGTVAGCEFEVKHFDAPSKYGIDGGRISKLWIRRSCKPAFALYDRGWDTMPDTEEDRKILAAILARFN